MFVCVLQLLYILYRIVHLWESFSGWHIAGYSMLMIVTFVCYYMISKAAAPTYAPLEKGGTLISGGSDLSQPGVLEYSWDMLYVTMFVQLATAFISDWFWLIYTIPPSVGFYFLWTGVIYPWISRPDPEPMGVPGQPEKGTPRKGERKVKQVKAR